MPFIDQVVTENGLLIAHDVYGRIHVLSPASLVPPVGGVPLSDYTWTNAFHTDTWTDTVSFQDLYDTASAAQFSFTPSANYSIASIILAQTGTNVISLVELLVDGSVMAVFPVMEENTIQLGSPIEISAGAVLTAKVKPGHKNTEVSLTVGGFNTP